jgi:hypothetical protein
MRSTASVTRIHFHSVLLRTYGSRRGGQTGSQQSRSVGGKQCRMLAPCTLRSYCRLVEAVSLGRSTVGVQSLSWWIVTRRAAADY